MDTNEKYHTTTYSNEKKTNQICAFFTSFLISTSNPSIETIRIFNLNFWFVFFSFYSLPLRSERSDEWKIYKNLFQDNHVQSIRNKYTEILTLTKTVLTVWYEGTRKGLNIKAERWSQNMVYNYEFAKWEKRNQRSHLMKIFFFVFFSWNKKFIFILWERSRFNALIKCVHTRTHIIQYQNDQSAGRFAGKRQCQKKNPIAKHEKQQYAKLNYGFQNAIENDFQLNE